MVPNFKIELTQVYNNTIAWREKTTTVEHRKDVFMRVVGHP